MYLRSMDLATDDQYLKLHYVVHCALDAVEEKGAPILREFQSKSAMQTDKHLGDSLFGVGTILST